MNLNLTSNNLDNYKMGTAATKKNKQANNPWLPLNYSNHWKHLMDIDDASNSKTKFWLKKISFQIKFRD